MFNDTRTERSLSFNHFIACDFLPSCKNTAHANENSFAFVTYQDNQYHSRISINSLFPESEEFSKLNSVCQEKDVILYHAEHVSPKSILTLDLFNEDKVIFVDIHFLSKILVPLLNNHSLISLSHYFEITHISDEEGFTSAKLIAEIFLNLKNLAVKLDNKPLQAIIKLLNGTKNPFKYFFEFIYNQPKCRKSIKLNQINYPVNIMGKVISPDSKKEKHQDIENKVKHFFEPDGLLASQFEHYEPRKNQQKMAVQIFKHLVYDEILIAEAGTGIGKSLAYLIPAVYYILNQPTEKVIITTHTKTLQEQLFYKEIPLTHQLISNNFLAVLLKGRGNYICLKRFFELLDHADQYVSDDQRIQLLTIIPWLSYTGTGDIEENNGFSSLDSQTVWHLINAAESNCSRGQCDYESVCFLQKIRKAVKSANIVVVNHSLLFSNLAQPNSVLGDIKTLIVDEAHHIEKSASQYLGDTISQMQLINIAHWIYQNHPLEKGIVTALQIGLNKSILDEKEAQTTENLIKDLKQCSFDLANHSKYYFKSLMNSIKKYFNSKDSHFKLRLTEENSPFPNNMETYFQLKTTIQSIHKIFDTLHFRFQTDTSKYPMQFEFALNDLGVLTERLSLWQMTIESFFNPNADKVYWCQQIHMTKKIDCIFHAVPIDMASILSDKLFSKLKRAVLTSATLAVNNSFDYVKYRWGLHFKDDDIVKTENFLSPFLYPEQMQFLIANYLPHPKTSEYTQKVTTSILSIISAIHRNTLVLFTSYQMLKAVYAMIQNDLEDDDVVLLAQGIHGSRSSILQKFKASKGSILLGTSSFWEGVDIPGEALECVIITRLPFDVPTDPVIEARVQRIAENNGNAFFQYTIPEALVKFRQGIGRLIRSGQDIGSMIVLDNRIVSTQYGKLFINASPADPVICNSEEEMLTNLTHWF